MPNQAIFIKEAKKLTNAAHVSSLGCDAAKGKSKNPQLTQLFSNEDNATIYQCATFNAKIANYQTDIVIDSGSGITVLSSELFNLINRCSKAPLTMRPCNLRARTATEEELNVIGTTTVELDLGESMWYVDCHVVHNFKYSFLLGTDFLIKSSACLDLCNMQVKIGQQSIPISVLKRPSQTPECILETLEIPRAAKLCLSLL